MIAKMVIGVRNAHVEHEPAPELATIARAWAIMIANDAP